MNLDDLKSAQAMVDDARRQVEAYERGRDAAMADMHAVGYSYSQMAEALDLDVNDVQERVERVKGHLSRSQRRRT